MHWAFSYQTSHEHMVAQIAYHVSMGEPLWDIPVQKGTVLYLALEDDYRRLQSRLYQMYGTEGTENLHFAVCAKNIDEGLEGQLEKFLQEHPDTLKSLHEKTVQIEAVEEIEVKLVPLTGKVMISKKDYDTLTAAAQKYVVQEKKEGKIQRLLDAANQKIQELLTLISNLKDTIFSLNHRVTELEHELAQEQSFEKKFAAYQIEQENIRLKQDNKRIRDILKQHGLLPKSREQER